MKSRTMENYVRLIKTALEIYRRIKIVFRTNETSNKDGVQLCTTLSRSLSSDAAAFFDYTRNSKIV